MIIAVDFDGTLYIGGKPNTALIGRLKTEQRNGNAVILWTCREGQRLKEAVLFLAKYGFRPNAVNENLPDTILRFGHNSRKIYADVYIDDKAAK